MTDRAGFRGQPLLLLGGVVALWVAMRVASWQTPFDLQLPPSVSNAIRQARVEGVSRPNTPELAPLASTKSERRSPTTQLQPAIASPAYSTSPIPPMWSPPLITPAVAVTAQAKPATVPPRSAIGHNLMLLAGLAQMEVPPAILAYLRGAASAPAGVPRASAIAVPTARVASTGSRWTGDGWLLWRNEGGAPSVAAQPSYGRSQAGAVVRYRLADGGTHPQAYLRATSAIEGPREREAAIGLSIRPLPRVPVGLAVEGRVTNTALGTEVRPAAFAVTELAPAVLPLGLRGEVYAQAGYVGGRFATAFVDGQARIDRYITGSKEMEMRAGAGTWGGAQKGASRLDVGPTAAVSFRVGDSRGRVAADYRFRVAGDAAPASGPAVTLSAGF